jgi:hypothetical protein
MTQNTLYLAEERHYGKGLPWVNCKEPLGNCLRRREFLDAIHRAHASSQNIPSQVKSVHLEAVWKTPAVKF